MRMALDLARALDPVSVFREGVRDADGEPVAPASWQEKVLRSTARRQLILCSRQAGKSTTIAAKAAGGLIYDPGLFLVVAPTLRQSRLLFGKITAIYKRLSAVPGIRSESSTELTLDNGAHLVALPGDDDATIRGFSAPKAIFIDEAARVSEAVYGAVRPMLAASPSGQLIALTTPYGQRGWLYEEWTFGKGWEMTRVTARDVPHISEDFLAEEREGMSEWQFRAEYLCEFTDTDEQFFASELIDAAIKPELETW